MQSLIFHGCTFWKDGKINHILHPGCILGCIVIFFIYQCGTTIGFRQFLFDGDSQWDTGQIVVREDKISKLSDLPLTVRSEKANQVPFMLVKHSLLLCMTLIIFNQTSHFKKVSASTLLQTYIVRAHWSNAKRVFDRKHIHVCGHASYTDMERSSHKMN